jgi:hypothetical protein
VNAELRELRRDIAEAADREASHHDDLLSRIEALTGDLRVLSAVLAGRSSPNG